MKFFSQLAIVACTLTTVINADSTAECMEAFNTSVGTLDHSSADFCDALSDYEDKQAHCSGEFGGRYRLL